MIDHSATPVLVTGGSGFLAGHVIVALLREGYSVRATLRDTSKAERARASIASVIDPGSRLSFVGADLLDDRGWDEACAGVDAVLHVASPMTGAAVERAAREGTGRVLAAATRAGVRRVVLTSSGLAALPPAGARAMIEETQWTERPDKPAFRYARAKTQAERAAWEFARSQPGAPELTTILPAFVQGPVLGADYSDSVRVLAMMLQGKLRALPNVGFSIVDVRDVAALHVLAMRAPEAAGQRYLAASEFLWFVEIAGILRESFGDRATKVSTRVLADWVLRAAAPFSAQAAQLAVDLGVRREIDASKARRALRWQPRPARQSIIDAAQSLLDKGLV